MNGSSPQATVKCFSLHIRKQNAEFRWDPGGWSNNYGGFESIAMAARCWALMCFTARFQTGLSIETIYNSLLVEQGEGK